MDGTDGLRRIGDNVVGEVSTTKICLKEILYSPDGKLPKDNNFCYPANQDSGSAMIQNEEIVAIFTSSTQQWLKDGSSLEKGCGINLQNPVIKSFLLKNLLPLKKPKEQINVNDSARPIWKKEAEDQTIVPANENSIGIGK